jgi:hypothetical protein
MESGAGLANKHSHPTSQSVTALSSCTVDVKVLNVFLGLATRLPFRERLASVFDVQGAGSILVLAKGKKKCRN